MLNTYLFGNFIAFLSKGIQDDVKCLLNIVVQSKFKEDQQRLLRTTSFMDIMGLEGLDQVNRS